MTNLRVCSFVICGLMAAALTACGGQHVTQSRFSDVIPDQDAQNRPAHKGPSFRTLFTFNGADGALPNAPPISAKGLLFGVTTDVGTSGCDYQGVGCGAIYKLTYSGRERVLHRFNGRPDGANPDESLIFQNGRFYGTTAYGGPSGNGTVFEMTPAGKEKVLYSFAGKPDGSGVFSSLTNLNGTFYGTTMAGGAYGFGTVFHVLTSGAEHVVHSFAGGTDGAYPDATLIVVNGMLYGTTYGGGARGFGTVFSVTPSGKEKALYAFKGGRDGAGPTAPLTVMNGVFYGTTSEGGKLVCRPHRCGTIFSLNGPHETILYRFKDGADGAHPAAGLTVLNGVLYGTASEGGADGFGTVFSMTTSGAENLVYTFTGGSDGRFPTAGLTAVNGTLYGTTQQGGNNGYGTVYALTP